MPKTRYGKSPWIEAFPKSRRPSCPRFKGTLETPVLVIGGGLTGCATLAGLAAAGIKGVLVEADRLGLGGSGHAPGLTSADAASRYLAFEKAHGRRAARAVFEATRHATRDLAAAVKRFRLKAPVATCDVLVVARRREHEKALQREAAARIGAGFAAPWLKPAAVTREAGGDSAGAMRVGGWGHVDPYKLTTGFAASALARKAVIFERSPVTRLRVRRDGVEVTLPGGIITAETVIVCTGEPSGLHPALERHFKRDERYVVMTEPASAAMRRAFGKRAAAVVDCDTPAHHLWWVGDRLMIAGADQPRTPLKGREKVWVQRTGQLMYEVLRTYPDIAGLMPAFGWDVPVARTADEVMVVGPHRNFPRQLFAWGGAHDPAHALLASRILVRHVRGEADKTDRLFSFTRG